MDASQAQSKKIMIVEDEIPLRKALSSKFSHEGYMTIEATDGKDALEKALQQHPDVIIADIFMPEMNGLEFVKNLRADQWGKTAQVIFLTNLNNTEEVMKAMEYGVEDYMVKADMKLEDIVLRVREKIGFITGGAVQSTATTTSPAQQPTKQAAPQLTAMPQAQPVPITGVQPQQQQPTDDQTQQNTTTQQSPPATQ